MNQKKYKCQFCSKHFESVDGLASHLKSKHEDKPIFNTKNKNLKNKPVSRLILFAWILTVIQIVIVIRLLFDIYTSLITDHFIPEILIIWGLVIILVFSVAFLSYNILIRQLGVQHKSQIKSCTINAALSIFTLFGIIIIGITTGLSLIRGIIPAHAEWIGSEMTSQGTHPTKTFNDIKNVGGLRSMGLSLLFYAIIIPAAVVLIILFSGTPLV